MTPLNRGVQGSYILFSRTEGRLGVAMKGRIVLAFGVLLFTASCANVAPPAITADRQALANIRTIYLGNLGVGDGTDLVREKLRVRLMQSGRFTIVESPQKAQAILTGVAGVETNYTPQGTRHAGTALVRLVDLRSEQTIWVQQYQRGYSAPGTSASSRVAEQLADALLRDAGR